MEIRPSAILASPGMTILTLRSWQVLSSTKCTCEPSLTASSGRVAGSCSSARSISSRSIAATTGLRSSARSARLATRSDSEARRWICGRTSPAWELPIACTHLCQKMWVKCSPNRASRGPGLGTRWNLSRVDHEALEGGLCHCTSDVVSPKGKVKGAVGHIFQTLSGACGGADDQDAGAVHRPRESDEYS